MKKLTKPVIGLLIGLVISAFYVLFPKTMTCVVSLAIAYGGYLANDFTAERHDED